MDADTRSRVAPRTSVVLYVGLQIQFRDLYKRPGLASWFAWAASPGRAGVGGQAHQKAQRELPVGKRESWAYLSRRCRLAGPSGGTQAVGRRWSSPWPLLWLRLWCCRIKIDARFSLWRVVVVTKRRDKLLIAGWAVYDMQLRSRQGCRGAMAG